MATASERLSPIGGEGEREPEDKGESSAQFFLEAFQCYIADIIHWRDLLFYPHFDGATRRKIREVSKTSESEAVYQMLDAILKHSEWPNRFQKLIELVDEAGNEKVLRILKGELIPDNRDIYRRLIDKHFKTICDNLHVMPLLACLKMHGIINDKDLKDIETAMKNQSNYVGALDLVLILHRRSVYWYPGFIISLIQSKQEDLARSIDKKLTEELLEKVKKGESLDDYTDDQQLMSMISLPDEETEVKQPYDDGETEPKQLMSSEFGTMEAQKVSFTSIPDQSVQNMDPKMMPNSYQDEGSLTSQTEIQKLSVEQATANGTMSVNNLSPYKPENHGNLSSQADSLDQSLDMDSLSFSFMLLNHDNTGVRSQMDRSVDGAANGYSFEDSAGGHMEYNDFSRDLDLEVPSMASLLSNETNSLQNKPTKKTDFSDFQRLTAKKPVSSLPSDDTPGDNVDHTLKGFRDKNVNLPSEQQLNMTESLGLDHEQEGVEDEDIALRHYQQELAAPALQGKNVIIVAPTGSGKTRVAMRIIQEHIRKQQGHGIAKVIFLVNQVALANQQAEACQVLLKRYSSKVITGESQRKSECLKDFIDKRDILIVTAQVLLDALVRKDISSINCFSLIVLDECHHTHANHTYNQIMGKYMELKFGKHNVVLPQIVGLTASVGVGKAKNVEEAVNHIKHLMANLDAHVICKVKQNLGELREYVSLPEEETCKVPKRQGDKFGEKVTLLMNTIEKRICRSSLVKEIPMVLKAPAEKGSAQYTQWVSKLWRETATLKSSEARRFLNAHKTHLEHYNNALIIYNDARMEDAVAYLDTEMGKWKENAIMDKDEKVLYSAFKKLRGHPFPKCTNPKLDKLHEMVTKAYDQDPENSRGIIFVKTRDLAKALVRWMKDTQGLRELEPIIFTGTNMSADRGGMTKAQQDDTLKYFRDGKHKLIVATSVAEEGLDISKCNLVIWYDHVTNEIAMVQSRGRGRASDSKYYVIAEDKTGMAEKEELNMIGEIMMMKAIIQLQEFIETSRDKFSKEIQKLQEANLDRELKALSTKPEIRMPGQFELCCIKCEHFVCRSDNIKKIEDSHHVVIGENLSDRVTFMRNEDGFCSNVTVQFVGKLICKNCGGNLGNICIHRTTEFPVLKIENFLVVDMNGRQSTCKRWKSVPFNVEPLSNDDWREIIKSRQGSLQP